VFWRDLHIVKLEEVVGKDLGCGEENTALCLEESARVDLVKVHAANCFVNLELGHILGVPDANLTVNCYRVQLTSPIEELQEFNFFIVGLNTALVLLAGLV